MERKLASIQKIADIRPIEGADKISVATLEGLGWEIVVKKGEHSVGETIVYVECDSIFPEKPEFEFLRECKFRIKIRKMRKQISQGIIFPLSILPPKTKFELGKDVTDALEIKKYDPQLQEENTLAEQNKPKSKTLKFFMNFAPFRFIYFKLNKKDKGWPSWIAKTDEERAERCLSLLTSRPDSEWYMTEKIDGQSAVFFVGKEKKWMIPRKIFGVGSRNIRLSKPDSSNYWKMAEKYDLKNKLLKLNKTNFVVNGEIVGGKVQGNKYKLPELDFFVFNVIDNGRKYTLEEQLEFCKQNGLKHVPVINANYVFKDANRPSQDIIKEITDTSIGKSQINKDVWREGIVVRLKSNPNISFKKINPEFLLKYNE